LQETLGIMAAKAMTLAICRNVKFLHHQAAALLAEMQREIPDAYKHKRRRQQ